VPAELAARIEVENNSLYQNRDKVARLKAEVTRIAVESCASDNACLQAEFDRADRAAAAYDTVLLLRQYPAMSKEKADLLAQAALDFGPVVSSASALYELMTGKTATGDEANRFFAAIGVVPVVGGIIKKGAQSVQKFAQADKALDVAEIGVAAPGIRRGTSDIAADSVITRGKLHSQLLAEEVANGHAFQKHVVERREFADLGISTKDQFRGFVERIVSNPAVERRRAIDGTVYYLDGSTKTIVIRGQRGEATAFRPDKGGVGWDNYIKTQVPQK
jgi:hypothetical protein